MLGKSLQALLVQYKETNMDFKNILSKLSSLDSKTIEGCGAMPTSMPTPSTPETPPPSMSVNLNAQGMDNIEQMMKLFQKVNPDMMPKSPAPMPSLSAPPGIMSITPDAGPKPINKLLPDLSDEPKDSGPDSMNLPPDHDKDHAIVKTLDKDGDGDHDMDDHDMDDEEKKEAWDNEPNEEEKDIDYMVNKLAGGLNRPKGTYPKVASGDNPMQSVKTESNSNDMFNRLQVQLEQKLAEFKNK